MLTGTFYLYGVVDGENAHYMQLTCSLPVVSVDENNVQADAAVFRLMEVDGSVQTLVPAWFRLKVMSGNAVLETIDQTVVKDELSYMLPTDRYGNADKLLVEAYCDDSETEEENNYEKKLAEITVPISRRNPIPFPRSEEWSADLTFRNGEYLMVGNIVYMWRSPVPGNSSLTPEQDIEQNPQTTSWVAYQNWPLLATQIFLAQWAKLGSFIFNGDLQMSQQGTVDGAENSDYTNPDFSPNFMVNAKTGRVDARNMNITGGTIGGFVVTTTRIGRAEAGYNGPAMLSDGFMYYSPSKEVRLGNAFTAGYDYTVASFTQALGNYDNHGSHEATVVIQVQGGGANIGDSMRECGLRIMTENGEDDYALDITGRVKAGGKKGLTRGVGFHEIWYDGLGYQKANLIFQDGLLVEVQKV